MNDLTRELATHILKSKDAWEPVRSGGKLSSYKPKLKYVHEQILTGREVLFYDQVYYPHLARLMEIARRRNLFPCVEEWEQTEMGYDDIILVWWPVSPDLHYDLVDIIGEHMQYYLEPIWTSEEWEIYELDESDLLSLGVVPDEIAVQPALL